MADKKLTAELNELSVKVFGKPYEWRKLRKRGLVHNRQRVGRGLTARRMPLTEQEAKHYMEETLRMREELKKEVEDQKNENR